MTAVRVLSGTDPEAVTDAVLHEYVRVLQASRERGQADIAVWITPTRRSQLELTRRLLRHMGNACWMPRITTFDGFAEWLLRRAGRPGNSISSTRRRLLLRRITQEFQADNQLEHFAPVAHSTGFLDVVAAFISELKRDEIWPEHFLTACGDEITPRDRELGRIYQRYQDVLLAQKWYDAEGRFWLARSELAEGRCEPLPAWQYIAAVGFADFTNTQHEILEQLARRTEQLVITLPWDDARPKLFEKSVRTWERLKKSLGQIRRETIAESNAEEPAFRTVIRTGLFSNPRTWKSASSAAGLEVVACTGSSSERAAVARRIKRLLAAGVPPGSIVVGLRSITMDGMAWKQALSNTGLPVWCEVGPRFQEQGLVKFLVAVLQSELQDWEFYRLMTVLDSSYFRPAMKEDVPSSVRAISSILRRMQLPERRSAILAAVERTAVRETKKKITRDVPLTKLARQTLPLLRWFAEKTEPLRRAHTLAGWIDVLAEIVKQFGAVKSARGKLFDADSIEDPPGDEGSTLSDSDLWDRVQRRLRDAAEAELSLGQEPRKLKLGEFLAEFRDLLSGERLDPEAEDPGCIRLLSFDQIRHVTVPHLFLAGLTEDSFPKRRGDDCLFTDAERQRLAQRGVTLLHQTLHQQEEMQFFYSLLLRASHRLTITYPEIDQRGQPVFPSPYLASLRVLFADSAWPLQGEGKLDPIPEPDAALTDEDVRLVATEAALSGNAGWLKWLEEAPDTRPMVRNLVAAMEMAHHRFATPGFTAYEGRLDHPPNLRAVAKRFGPDRQFSASELEDYAKCPFRFFLQRVLDLEPLAEPTEGTDHLGRGNLVHEVLAELLPDTPTSASRELAQRFRELVSRKLDRIPSNTELQRALTRIERELLDQWAAAYAGQVDQYAIQVGEHWDGPWQPAAPELAFGNVPGQTDSEASAYPPLELGDGDRRVKLRGRIDRIDFGSMDGRPVFTVIDYKTGKELTFNEQQVESGKALQLVLYTLAVQRLGISPADAVPFQLGYWYLKATGFTPGSKSGKKLKPIESATWQVLVDLLEETVPALAEGIRHGEFVVSNDDQNCTGHCDFRTVCRVNQVRSLATKLVKVRRDFR